jgi:RHS repeat-associated protein
MTWGYYPDGKLASLTDAGVPTGLYAEVTQETDPGAKASPATAWTTTACGSTAGCEGTQYATHAPGTGTDSFTWPLYIPADGNYTVYVKYPSVSGAATSATYTVAYNGGTATATATADQTKNAGSWVALGKWAFTQSGKGQQLTLAENSGGTVVADGVKIVRDTTGTTNTATHAYAYTYDADGQQTGIADTSPGAAVANYVTAYDQDGRTTSVSEDNSSGTAVHTTTDGYDADSNLTSQIHDATLATPAYGTYTYNNLEQLSQESDAKSSTDPSPQVSTFAYNPVGLVASEVKPNANTAASTYYANGLLYQQTEKTSGGTLVSSHAYTYDPNGNTTQNVEQLMSADSSSSYLSHTLGYTYTPTDQVATASTDGTQTESYTHDAGNNVTAQTVNGTTTTYGYAQGQLATATTAGTTADYNYDPFGRLDTVTAAGQTLQSSTYDGFDNLASTSQWNTTTQSMDTTSYTYDSLNRMASQTTAAGTSSFSYLGLSSELASEADPNSTSKTYDYTPGGTRLSQDTTSGGTTTPGYYSYNAHSDVEALTGASGTTTATYGYTAYGNPITSMFTGADKNNATASPASTTTPYSSYRFNAMRWDSSSGQYDMGFRNYDPSLNQFASRDMYDGALADAGLATDPFTGSRYAFGAGNPVSNIELNGHSLVGSAAGGGCPPPELTCGGPNYINVPTGSSNSGSSGGSPNPAPSNAPNSAAGALSWIPNFLDGGHPGEFTALWNRFMGWEHVNENSPNYKLGQLGGDSVGAAYVPEDDFALLLDLPSALKNLDRGPLTSAARACLTGQSFTASTRVLLADGKAVPISALKPGDKVLATNTKTGKTTPETVAAVEVNHDHDLYDLKVKTFRGVGIIHTTASHLFWDPSLDKWLPASNLKPGEHLKAADGAVAVVVGGSVPAVHDGWMWDLTVPGNNDHDFYVAAGSVPVLVHNDSCDVAGLVSQIDSSNLSMSKTVQNHAWDIAGTGNKDAVNFGKLARPYMSGNNMQLIQEIMEGSGPVLDSRGAPGVVEWRTPGSMNGSDGTWELNINANTNTIVHFLFKGAGK